MSPGIVPAEPPGNHSLPEKGVAIASSAPPGRPVRADATSVTVPSKAASTRAATPSGEEFRHREASVPGGAPALSSETPGRLVCSDGATGAVTDGGEAAEPASDG